MTSLSLPTYMTISSPALQKCDAVDALFAPISKPQLPLAVQRTHCAGDSKIWPSSGFTVLCAGVKV